MFNQLTGANKEVASKMLALCCQGFGSESIAKEMQRSGYEFNEGGESVPISADHVREFMLKWHKIDMDSIR